LVLLDADTFPFPRREFFMMTMENPGELLNMASFPFPRREFFMMTRDEMDRNKNRRVSIPKKGILHDDRLSAASNLYHTKKFPFPRREFFMMTILITQRYPDPLVFPFPRREFFMMTYFPWK